MRKIYLAILALFPLLTAAVLAVEPDRYNIVWDSPSKDHHGSMPLGNGDIGLNVWVEKSGDLCFYIGKTDSWGDNGRLLKVGKVRVKTDPSLVIPGGQFRQELDLQTGSIQIFSTGKSAGEQVDYHFKIWVDAGHPVIHIDSQSNRPAVMTAFLEPWRTEPYSLPSLEVSDLLEDRSQPGNLHEPVIVEPDVVFDSGTDYIGWYHHNKKSVGFDLTNRLQGLEEYFQSDPILHRTFGAVITGSRGIKLNDKSLATGQSRNNHLSVYVLTSHPSTPEDWLRSIGRVREEVEARDPGQLWDSHRQWWQEFWSKSWIMAQENGSDGNDEEDDAFVVSRAYALQRFIDAAAGRGPFPIKFNGSIFTVPYEGKPGDADYRRWGPGYWWQNTRLPYLSMLASGDLELLQPFFDMYAETVFKTNLYRTKKYFGIDGAYFPECIYFWGSVFTSSYGWEPYEEREDPLQVSGYHKWEWVAGPELVFMMLDYWAYTGDEQFLTGKIVPVANAVLKFFDGYYKTDGEGKLVMHPSQACETWWDCLNPMPELAGLHAVTKRLLQLPAEFTSEKDRQFWLALQKKLPSLPLRETESGKALAPAEKFANKRNVENPELYAVFPFRLIALGNPNPEWGINALEHRWDSGDFGWRQDDLFMAYLGLTDQAKKNLVSRARSYDKESRFPAFWGPNYDWVPDQDHGGVLMKALQSMLLQADPYSDKIYLLPAWPKEWDCEFRLHAPRQTVIEGKVSNGRLASLLVTPDSRRKDIVLAGGFEEEDN